VYDSGAEDWAGLFAGEGGFTPLEHRRFAQEQEMDVDLLLDRVSSTSYIAALSDSDRAGVLAQVRAVVAAAGLGATFPLPHTTDVFWCTKPA
jgi:hypothetical protein